MTNLGIQQEMFKPGIVISEEVHNLSGEGGKWRIVSRPRLWRPPTDVYETEEAMVVRVEIAGMSEDDFSISLVERSLLIRGIRQDTPERRAYHQMEIAFGEFNTEVELPYQVIADQVEATYRDGFLRIVLPKAQPQQIRVNG